MSFENNFLIEFPADRDYVPFIQDFLRDYLKNYDFTKEFANYAANESLLWFDTFIPEEKFLHALPTISFSGRCASNVLSIKINTSDKKEFMTSLSTQNMEEAK